MRKLIILGLLLILPAISFGQLRNGYEIDLTINGLPDSTVYLAYHLGDKQYIKDTIKLNRYGHGIIHGREVLQQGIYMVVLPGKKYFEFLVSSVQHFSMSTSFRDYVNTLKFNGSAENTAFVDYQKKWVGMQQRSAAISKRIQNNRQNNDSLKILNPLLRHQEENMKVYLKSVLKANEGNLLGLLIKAMLPVDIPEISLPAGYMNPDSVKWIRNYLYNKNHYFDNIDLTDERLLRTPILHARLDAFFTSVLIQAPDSHHTNE
jgi:hypothetical protein